MLNVHAQLAQFYIEMFVIPTMHFKHCVKIYCIFLQPDELWFKMDGGVVEKKAFDAARQAIQHIKCRVILKNRKKMKNQLAKEPQSTSAKYAWMGGSSERDGTLPEGRESSSMISMLLWVIVLFLIFDVFHSLIRYRCRQYGGKKCKYPFDLLPESMIANELWLH